MCVMIAMISIDLSGSSDYTAVCWIVGLCFDYLVACAHQNQNEYVTEKRRKEEKEDE